MLLLANTHQFDLPLPAGVRIATQADEQKLHDLLLHLYKNNYLGFEMSDRKVWDVIRHCCRGGGGIAGVIERDGEIVASVGIVFSSMWYSEAPYLSELWLFVRPDCRHHKYAEKLVDFCHFYRDQTRAAITGQALPLVTSVTSYNRLAGKMRWWRRWSRLVGAIFVVDGM